MLKFTQIRPVGAAIIYTNRRAERQTDGLNKSLTLFQSKRALLWRFKVAGN